MLFPEFAADGTVKSVTTSARDITDYRRTEEALRNSEERLRAILDAVQTGILVIDPEEHTITYVNPVAARMICASREEIVGERCHRFVCPAEEGRCPITDLGAPCGQFRAGSIDCERLRDPDHQDRHRRHSEWARTSPRELRRLYGAQAGPSGTRRHTPRVGRDGPQG